VQADVFVGIDVVEAEGHEFARGVVQFCGEFDTGRARSDDRHIELSAPQRHGLGVRPKEGVDQPTMEAVGLGGAVEGHRVLDDARRAEIIDIAAHGQHQQIVADAPSAMLLVHHRTDQHFARGPIEADHLAVAVLEAMPMRLREVIELVDIEVDGAGRQFVQVGLPEVRATALDERDLRATAPTEGVAETGGKLEAAGTATDDDDVRTVVGGRIWDHGPGHLLARASVAGEVSYASLMTSDTDTDTPVRVLQRVIDAQRTADGAGVTLWRSLGQGPFARLDPFLMLDEFGSDRPDEYIKGFPAHPHRGFQTVTYMLAGHMLHEDHLGNRGHLRAGDVQWMSAGRGIIHSEMPQQESGLMRGFQLWLNLPAAEKMRPAEYRDIPAAAIPELVDATGVRAKVVAGELSLGGGHASGPVTGISTQPLFVDVELPAGTAIAVDIPASHHAYCYVYEGAIGVPAATGGEATLRARQGGVLGGGTGDVGAGRAAQGLGLRVTLRATQSRGRALLLAARPIGEPVVQYGPFVMNTREEIDQAIRDFQSGRLTAV
jgi:quercetin 2,3-dioxygenase